MGIDIREVTGKVVRSLHKSDGHGDVLYIEFTDGTQLTVWAFDQPDRLQMVLWNPNTDKIIQDKRSAACKDYTDKVYAILANRKPPVHYNAPFKTFHRTEYVPE